jgi:hypothetical protein
MKRKEQSLTRKIVRREEGFSLYFAGANRERGPKQLKANIDTRQQNSVSSKRLVTRTKLTGVSSVVNNEPIPNKWKQRINNSVPQVVSTQEVQLQIETKSNETKLNERVIEAGEPGGKIIEHEINETSAAQLSVS